MIHQDLSHEARGQREEVGPIFGLKYRLVDQSQVSLVDQRGALQGVSGTFLVKVTPRNDTELGVHHGDELMKSLSIPGFPPDEEFADWSGRHPGRTPSVAFRIYTIKNTVAAAGKSTSGDRGICGNSHPARGVFEKPI